MRHSGRFIHGWWVTSSYFLLMVSSDSATGSRSASRNCTRMQGQPAVSLAFTVAARLPFL